MGWMWNNLRVRIPGSYADFGILVRIPIRQNARGCEIEIVLLQWTHQESATSQRTIPRDCLCDLAHRHWPARSERFKWQDMHTFIQL